MSVDLDNQQGTLLVTSPIALAARRSEFSIGVSQRSCHPDQVGVEQKFGTRSVAMGFAASVIRRLPVHPPARQLTRECVCEVHDDCVNLES